MADAFDATMSVLFKKVLVLGYPKTGKSKFATHFFGDRVIHTDQYMDFGWDKCTLLLMRMIQDQEEWVIEGVQCFRLLREMLKIGVSIPDLVIYMEPLYDVLEEHETMRKGLDTIWDQCLNLNQGRVRVQLATERLIPSV